MRKLQIWTSLFLFLLTTNFIHAQNISMDIINQTATVFSQSDFVSASAIITNHSPEVISIAVKREIIEGRNDWVNGIGIDDRCYDVSIDEIEITLEPYTHFTLKSRFLLLEEESNTSAEVHFQVINSNKPGESLSFTTKGINGKHVIQPQTTVKGNSIRIFPNPAMNYINIATDEIIDQIEIFDSMGRSIMQDQGSNKVLDITSLTNGFYTLVLKTNGGDSSYTFIKQ